jgi:hypothetical protein
LREGENVKTQLKLFRKKSYLSAIFYSNFLGFPENVFLLDFFRFAAKVNKGKPIIKPLHTETDLYFPKYDT